MLLSENNENVLKIKNKLKIYTLYNKLEVMEQVKKASHEISKLSNLVKGTHAYNKAF